MLQKGALRVCQSSWSGLSQPPFFGEGDGGWQPVMDLSTLSGFVTLTKFRIETVALVLRSIRNGDCMFSIDLKDAYFQIPIHPDSHPYLQFIFKGQVFQFQILCFGLCMAPQLFTRVISPISEWVHQRGVRLLRYLDNWLIVAESLPPLFHHRSLLLQLYRDLGIAINWEKLDLQPSTWMQYLVMVIDTSRESAFPSETRMSRFRDLAAGFLALPSPPARMWQQLLGHSIAGAFSYQGSLSHMSSSVASQGPLVSHVGRSVSPSPSVARVRGRCGTWPARMFSGLSYIPFPCPLGTFLARRMSWQIS